VQKTQLYTKNALLYQELIQYNYKLYVLNIFFWLGFILFAVAFFSFFFGRDEFIRILITFEIMYLANIMFFCFISYFFNYQSGYVIALLLLAVAAVETAIGLALLIRAHRVHQSIEISSIAYLRLK